MTRIKLLSLANVRKGWFGLVCVLVLALDGTFLIIIWVAIQCWCCLAPRVAVSSPPSFNGARIWKIMTRTYHVVCSSVRLLVVFVSEKYDFGIRQ